MTAETPAPAAPGLAEDVPTRLNRLARQLVDLHEQMVVAEGNAMARYPVHPVNREALRNLTHYLVLRQHDLRPLQAELSSLGLSSLGRTESHTLAQVEAVLRALAALGATVPLPPRRVTEGQRSADPHASLDAAAVRLLGRNPVSRHTRIMVTMPPEAATDPDLVREMLLSGMDVMRINAAHDDPAAWAAMVANLRAACETTGRDCRILMDLAGPKLRTGPIAEGPRVIRLRPRRDAYGRVVVPARALLTDLPPAGPPGGADAVLPVPASWMAVIAAGDVVSLTDARGRHRELRVVAVTREGAWAECQRTAYLVPETELVLRPVHGDGAVLAAAVGDLPAREQAITVAEGDLLMLTRSQRPGQPARRSEDGRVIEPAFVPCTLEAVFQDARPGERIWFDDGLIGGVIEDVAPERLLVRIMDTSGQVLRLKSEKGINLPDTLLRVPAMTDKDLVDLEFVARHADMVALSFVRSPQDVRQLREALERLGRGDMGIVLKIETRQGFEALPQLLGELLQSERCGVMIARGDLAVECGFERVAELQEEVLWICEAAHIPAIWATQVLETMARTGVPSRAEITDAAMGVRAECVMLNKGPYILRTIRALDDILHRMEAHQTKKASLLRRLRSWTIPDA